MYDHAHAIIYRRALPRLLFSENFAPRILLLKFLQGIILHNGKSNEILHNYIFNGLVGQRMLLRFFFYWKWPPSMANMTSVILLSILIIKLKESLYVYYFETTLI